jgi:2-succinyl-6-hydroxy-2,4-cyclohexadiene-1-carboxylate synthase
MDKRLSVNQIELQIQDYPHAGAALIFLHFSGANLMMWSRAVPYFQEDYRVILVDLRGHGRSDRPESGYHMDDMARDVIGIMDQLHLEQAHIIGSSLGAEVGLSMAASYPQRVLSLVCDGALSSESGPYGTWDGSEAEFEAHVTGRLAKMRANPEKTFPSVEALLASRREIFAPIGWWNETVAAMERYGAHPIGENQYVGGLRKAALVDYMTHYFHYRFEEFYPRVQCPLLLVAEEEIEDEREAAAMAGLCALAAQGEIRRIPGWQHPYGWLLDPEAICREILDFLPK